MNTQKFKTLNKAEKIDLYGGFAWLVVAPLMISLVQTIVSAGIAIYQAVANKTGSVSLGGTKAITSQQDISLQSRENKLSHSTTNIFSAY